jgi:hypothetical protein
MRIINWEIAKNPFNWFIIVLMLLIAAIGVHQLVKFVQNSATSVSAQPSES